MTAVSEPEGLTQEELDAARGEQLPEREAMSLVDLGDSGAAAVPVDAFAGEDVIPTDEVHDPSQPPF